MTIQEAAQHLHKSEATIRRWIKQGKLSATMIDGRYEIEESALSDYAGSEDYVGSAYTSVELEHLRRQNEELLRQISDQKAKIESLESRLEEERRRVDEALHRHDTVVMQMTRLVEYHQQPFWRRWFGQKALPAQSRKA